MNKIFLTVVLVGSFFLLTGCDKLRSIDDKLGEIMHAETDIIEANYPQMEVVKASTTDSALLSKEQKEKVDEWLEKNDFNRYGDRVNTFYKSGTPLLDEVSGVVKERYEYIREKHPDILTKIKEAYDKQQ